MAEESRQDRELIELLNELRVTLPGLQVMFAFLLIVPFSQQFGRVNDVQKYAYLVCLIATALGAACLIAPTPFHRIRFRNRDKEAILQISNRLAIVGAFFLATAMTSAVFLVSDYLFRSPVPVLVTGAVAVAIYGLWFVVPLARDRSR